MLKILLPLVLCVTMSGCAVSASQQDVFEDSSIAKSYVNNQEIIDLPLEVIKDRMYLLKYRCTTTYTTAYTTQSDNSPYGVIYSLIDENDDDIVVTRSLGNPKVLKEQTIQARVKFIKVSASQTKIVSHHYLDILNQETFKKEKDHIIEWALGEHQICL